MVLLDRLVERGLAQQQEAEANPHGQQPGHGEAESAGQHIEGVGGGQGQNCIKMCVFNSLGQTKERQQSTYISSEKLSYVC